MILGAGLDAALAALIIGTALWTIAARDLFTAVVAFIALGLLLALAWVRLAAPDVALTEAAIGTGVTGVILVAAAARGGPTENLLGEAAPPSLRIMVGIVAIFAAAGLTALMLSLSEPAPTLAPAAAAHLALTGLGNPVNAVLLAYRAIDTLLEVIVLLFALLAVWSLTPDRVWGGRPGQRQNEDPNGVLVFLARWLPPIGTLVGIHLFWIGSVAPGGEFQSASVLAAMWILMWMAGLVDFPMIERCGLRFLVVVGPMIFLAIGVSGFVLAGAFLGYPAEHAKSLIIAIELPVTMSIVAILTLLVAGPPQRAPQT